MNYTNEEKKAITLYINYQLRRNNYKQIDLAEEYGCTQSAINHLINFGSMSQTMPTMRAFIAKKLGRASWEELCIEAITYETHIIVG